MSAPSSKLDPLRLKQQPYHLLLLAALALVLTSFFHNGGRTVDIHVHDTYFVLTYGSVFMVLAFGVWILWFLYQLTHKALYSKGLTRIHVVTTLLTVVFLLLLLYLGEPESQPGSHVDYRNAYDETHQRRKGITYSLNALLLGQLTFVIHVFLGSIKRFT